MMRYLDRFMISDDLITHQSDRSLASITVDSHETAEMSRV